MASMVGAESMTSADWMLLALSSMGQGTQKKVGETFVQRLLEKGDIHPAVAILLGLGEHNDAIEVYVSCKYYMEAILLTCLMFPTDWQRQSFLVRKWGEAAVSHGKAELAVKCFSCMGLESSEPWFSPRAQDAVFVAQKQQLLGSQLSPPLSPPSASNSRITAKMSSLKLVTDFGAGPLPRQMVPEEDEQTPMNVGATPIAESAMSPAGGKNPWLMANNPRAARDPSREPSSARTATPGAYRRKRFPSQSGVDRSATNNEKFASLVVPNRGQREPSVPRTAVDNIGREAETLPFSTRRAASTGPEQDDLLLTAATYKPSQSLDHLPSPAAGVFDTLKEKEAESRNSSRSRNRQDLHLHMNDIVIEQGPNTGYSSNMSPPLTGASVKSAKARSIDQYISSLGEASHHARKRAESRTDTVPPEVRPSSRTARTRSRTRDASESRGRSGARYIQRAKRSPSSPVPMSPEDAGIYARSSKEAATNTDTFDDERYYKVDVASPIATESVGSNRTNRSRARAGLAKPRSSSKAARSRAESPEAAPKVRSRAASRASSRHAAGDRGRSSNREESSTKRSPRSPQPMFREESYEPVRPRERSSSRRPQERGTSSQREQSPDRRLPRDRSMSRKAQSTMRESSRPRGNLREASLDRMSERNTEARPASRQSDVSGRSGKFSRPMTTARKELAAKELEERRLSLARRPSAPMIPHPGQLAHRPVNERAHTENDFLTTYRDPIQRSHTADPEISKKYSPTNRIPVGATSTVSVPIGLPATPRAMRHTRYMSTDPNEREGIPAVPSIPNNLVPVPQEPQESAQDEVGPLLPATTFGQPPPLARAASAPPEDFSPVNMMPRVSPTYPLGRRGSLGGNRGHSRQSNSHDFSSVNNKRVSPPPITASIAETIHESQVVILEDGAPPLLAELQHLAGPPPPPPPPPQINTSPKSSVGMISIAIDENPSVNSYDATSPVAGPSTTSSPMSHRRGRGSVSENIGMTFKRVTDRMRSTSRSRNKSPPISPPQMPAYESMPEFSFPRNNYGMSPVEGHGGTEQFGNMSPPPPPPPPVQPMEQVISPTEEAKNSHFYKHPREIRANMSQTMLQAGVYEGPMI